MLRKFCFPYAAATSEGTGGGAPAAAAGTPAAAAPAASTPAAGTPAAGAVDDKGSKGGSEKPGDQAAAGAPAAKVPAKYELTIPEGGEAYLGPEDLAYIEGVARASEWTNDEAQQEIAEAVKRSAAREDAQSKKLLADFQADKDYGGANLEATQQLSKRAVDGIFPEGHRLREGLLSTLSRKTVANNLTIVAFLAEVGRRMGEDSPGSTRAANVAPTGTGDQQKADKLYDHPTSRALDGKA